MGQEFKRDTGDQDDDQFVEKAEKLMEDANSFADKLAKAVGDAKTAVEKKQKFEDADGTKKKSQQSSASESENNGENDMDIDIEDINSAIDKLKAVNGNMTLEETQEWLEENEEMVEQFI